jgi:hypothetical protein
MVPQLDMVNKVVQLLASAPSTDEIISYRPAKTDLARFDELIAKKKAEGLTSVEQKEADNFLLAEHMMRMAKLYALDPRSRQTA